MRSLQDVVRVARRFARTGQLRAGFAGSASYWEERYQNGGNSGPGSYGRLAEFKAEILNDFIRREAVTSVIEFGCGDGSQLALLDCGDYLGVDVSVTAVEACRRRFAGDDGKAFCLVADYASETADMTLSLDVVYHLVEDAVFDAYMRALFDAATRFVVVYASNHDAPGPSVHVRHRRFTDWIAANRPEWTLRDVVANRFPFKDDTAEESFADFHFFDRAVPGSAPGSVAPDAG
ncbi:methyltransferase domain-containing protein [Jiella endophytica]|uniref:methyltransferase domain-containing protein n=1 Tax=Jiella endophytica TaxID=2558362 RepID=UPI00197E19B3|nr:class I SAM-dependent methyltransferase [Jiella endophytica]